MSESPGDPRFVSCRRHAADAEGGPLTTGGVASLAVLFAGSCLQGMTGFGYSLFCLPLLGLFMPVREAVPILSATSILLNVLVLHGSRRSLRLRWLLPLLAAGIVGTPLGVWLLGSLDETVLRTWIGILVILSAVALLSGFRARLVREGPAMVPVGLVSGLLNGAASFSGPP